LFEPKKKPSTLRELFFKDPFCLTPAASIL
jgi:hypothetical protein